MKSRNLVPFQGWRLTFFQAIVFAVFAIFAIQLYRLQVLEFEQHDEDANENRLTSLPIAADRGAIFDRNGNRMAFNVPAFNVEVTPAELPDNEDDILAIFTRLSVLVDVPPTREIADAAGIRIRSIEELVQEGEGIAPFRPVVVASDVPLESAMQILEERIYMPGVNVEPISVREYPQVVIGDRPSVTSSHVIGYMGPIPEEEAEELRERGYNPAFDRIGYEGIERFLETQLGGQRGSIISEVDVAGEVINVIEQIDPTPGQNVRLTIDTELQAFAEDSLRFWLNERNTNPQYGGFKGISSQGVVIAMNPSTGEILAMVSWPTYDNTRFARAIDGEYYLRILEDPALPLVNNAIKGLYPPGSVWKLLTAAGVLEEDVINPETQLFDEGTLVLENRYAPNDPARSQEFVCWLDTGHQFVNMVQGIAWSCDVYFYQIGGGNPDISPQTLKPGGLGINDLFRYATAMGIGSELGVELPFEAAGRMPDPDWKRRNFGESWSTGDTYNAAFGQGYVTTTPLQLIASTASLVNDGTLYQPTVIREILDSENNVIESFEPQILRTLNVEAVPPEEPLTLLLLEDMLMQGENSLACTCESDSPHYNPDRCDPLGYRNTVDLNPDPFIEEPRTYQVHLPRNYTFNGSVCQPIRFRNPNNPYQPTFITDETFDIVQEGMLGVTTIEGGTATFDETAILPSFEDMVVAGKTGTAEYCDDVARPLGFCIRGQWPAHAWYVGYGPYENPEIMVIAFMYNGGEGSGLALPIVRETMNRYFELKQERLGATAQNQPQSVTQ